MGEDRIIIFISLNHRESPDPIDNRFMKLQGAAGPEPIAARPVPFFVQKRLAFDHIMTDVRDDPDQVRDSGGRKILVLPHSFRAGQEDPSRRRGPWWGIE